MTTTRSPRQADLPAFAQQRIKLDPAGCWLWTGVIQRAGYGTWGDATAHRRVWELLVGPLPAWSPAADAIELDHLCRVRRCVNPAHLEPVTRWENQRRGLGPLSRTHCPHGHELAGDNLVRSRLPHRQCRVCHLARQAAWRERQRA